MSKSSKTALIIGGIILVILVMGSLLWSGFSGWQGGYGMMGPGMMGWGVMGGFMGIGMIIFWGLIIWGIVALVRGGAPGCGSGQSDSALEVLKRRYARGEISKEEFEEKKRDLI